MFENRNAQARCLISVGPWIFGKQSDLLIKGELMIVVGTFSKYEKCVVSRSSAVLVVLIATETITFERLGKFRDIVRFRNWIIIFY